VLRRCGSLRGIHSPFGLRRSEKSNEVLELCFPGKERRASSPATQGGLRIVRFYLHNMLIAFAVILTLLILPLYAGTCANALSLHSGDPAGNAMAAAFGALTAMALSVLIGLLTICSANYGSMPGALAIASLLLIPASGASVVWAITQLSKSRYTPKWLTAPVVICPLMWLIINAWIFFAGFRERVSIQIIYALLGVIVLASAVPIVGMIQRNRGEG